MLRLVLTTDELAPAAQNPADSVSEPQQLNALLQTLLQNAAGLAPHVEGVLASLANTIQQAVPQVVEATAPRHCHWGQNRQKASELGNEGTLLIDGKSNSARNLPHGRQGLCLRQG